jgi:hypothetical protein
MNKDNAKQFLPLIQALAEGKTIQWLVGKTWHDLDTVGWDQDPTKYRIKPEKKRGWLVIMNGSLQPLFNNEQQARKYIQQHREQNKNNKDSVIAACIEIEYEEGQGLATSAAPAVAPDNWLSPVVIN